MVSEAKNDGAAAILGKFPKQLNREFFPTNRE
jgi:hypothetical protein